MATSSVSTYLDVTQAAKKQAPTAPDASGVDPEFTARAAKVLAAIHAGADLVTDLPERSELTMSEILTLLAWLSDSGLVELDDADGVMHARLTKVAETALAAG
jgi:hypothetical protein